ncbi:MAG: MMPL family transporter [Pseudonocardiaceae bacterium]
MASLLSRLGQFSARRHWLVIISWAVLLCIAALAFSMFSGPTSTALSIPGTKTDRVQAELQEKFPAAQGGTGTVVFTTANGKVFSDVQKRAVATFLNGLNDIPGVKQTTDGFATQQDLDLERRKITEGKAHIQDARAQLADSQTQLNAQKAQVGPAGASDPQLQQAQQAITAAQKKLDRTAVEIEQGAALLALSEDIRFVSESGSAAIGTVAFTKTTDEVSQATKTAIADRAEHANIDGVHAYVSNDLAQSSPPLVGPGEIVGLSIAALVLFLILRTVLGSALPLVSAILGVGVASLTALSFSSLVQFTSVTPVLAMMLGLAVGIDYSLFIINRHRTQLKRGMELYQSIGLANGTSGNAVVFAGTTVIIALLALNITGIPFLGLMGTVGAVAVFFAILIAISFTPALLSLVGHRILSRKERAHIGHPATKIIPAKPMATWRAIITVLAGIVMLGVIAIPASQMHLGLPTGSSEATDSTQYMAYSTQSTEFGVGQNGQLLVVANLPEPIDENDVTATSVTIGQALARNTAVAAVLPIGTSVGREIIAFQVKPKIGPDSPATEQLVTDLREQRIATDGGKVTLGVAGNASANIDITQKIANVLPLYLAVVIGLSLIILIIVFRSILVPITATAGFVLSLLATLGSVTAIYQFGWLGSLFGVHNPGPIVSFLPILLIGILFGLAMDYQLFLVSGMREAHVHGASARVAVQRGLQAGRAVVAAAAAIMIAVFAGFIFSEASTIRLIGFGLSFGVLLDAFVVRMLLIPAAMHLLGKYAWWLPKWLDRIIPNVDVEGAELEREADTPQSHPGAARA